jgi:Rps23 Pro-64 3,4-dihydroxylase Tpa1-like proline 4-hydroxylase
MAKITHGSGISILRKAEQEAYGSRYMNIEFTKAEPFSHIVIDNFFHNSIADKLASEFLEYDDKRWFHYSNPLEEKKALNDWNVFPLATYQAFNELISRKFISWLRDETGYEDLIPDYGLHGGGWHIHASGGNLNPHLDYEVHPKLKAKRKLNLIVYLGTGISEENGGHLGLWKKSDDGLVLQKEIAPMFNRAVLFDTTQNSWHGMSRPFEAPMGVYRKSIAVYYLEPGEYEGRMRALFAPREFQIGDKNIESLIQLRADENSSKSAYRTNR